MTWNELLVAILDMSPEVRRLEVELFDYSEGAAGKWKDLEIQLPESDDDRKPHFTTG